MKLLGPSSLPPLKSKPLLPVLPRGTARTLARLALAVLMLAACQPRPSQPAPGLSPAASQEPVAQFTPAVIVSEQTNPDPASNLEISASQPTSLPPPLRFSIPAERQQPLSAWRPPLYPTPWALAPYDHFYFARPIAADQVNWPEEDYRYGGNFFADVVHTGVDIPVPKGTPVLAAGSGKVIWAGYGAYRGGYDKTDPYGQSVIIRHDYGYEGQSLFTLYGHLDRVDVGEGQHVEVGQVLGLSGETGQVTGPHLHFEVRLGENNYFKTRNPELWMVPPQGWGVLAARIMDTNHQLMPYQEIIVTNLSSDQNWKARSYGKGTVNSDPYYNENLVIGDLPAGLYLVRISYAGLSFTLEFEVRPGVVSFFSFAGRSGFDTALPKAPGSDFDPNVTPTAKK
jgi:murein DD-endopeptidase MepM/ murein hydrolase activator NlpD